MLRLKYLQCRVLTLIQLTYHSQDTIFWYIELPHSHIYIYYNHQEKCHHADKVFHYEHIVWLKKDNVDQQCATCSRQKSLNCQGAGAVLPPVNINSIIMPRDEKVSDFFVFCFKLIFKWTKRQKNDFNQCPLEPQTIWHQ